MMFSFQWQGTEQAPEGSFQSHIPSLILFFKSVFPTEKILETFKGLH